MITLLTFLAEPLDVDPDYLKVLRTLARLRISYPSELSRETFIDDRKIMRILDYYRKEGAIKPVILNPDIVHPKLKTRLSYFWSKGIKSFNDYQKRHWIECEDKLYWGDKKKFEEQQVKEELVS